MKLFKGYMGAIQILHRLAQLEETQSVPIPSNSSLTVEQLQELNRLRLMAKVANASEKAKEIEEAWRKIQQDKNDAEFKLGLVSISCTDEAKTDYAYKKGIAEGIQWVLNRFS